MAKIRITVLLLNGMPINLFIQLGRPHQTRRKRNHPHCSAGSIVLTDDGDQTNSSHLDSGTHLIQMRVRIYCGKRPLRWLVGSCMGRALLLSPRAINFLIREIMRAARGWLAIASGVRVFATSVCAGMLGCTFISFIFLYSHSRNSEFLKTFQRILPQIGKTYQQFNKERMVKTSQLAEWVL